MAIKPTKTNYNLRHTSDIYPTPPHIARWGIVHALQIREKVLQPHNAHKEVSQPHNDKIAPIRVLDIGAGPGVWGRVVAHIHEPVCEIVGIEIERAFPMPNDYTQWIVSDFRNVKHNVPFQLIVSNPPFSLAEEAVTHAVNNLGAHGIAVFLLPLNFLASQKRVQLFINHPPLEVVVLAKRPSFYTLFADQIGLRARSTDAREYALFFWGGAEMYEKLRFPSIIGRDNRSWRSSIAVIEETLLDKNLAKTISNSAGTAVCAIVHQNKVRKKNGDRIWDIRTYADTIRKHGWNFYYASDQDRELMVVNTMTKPQ